MTDVPGDSVRVADAAHAYVRGFCCALEATAQAQARRTAAAGMTFATVADHLRRVRREAQLELCDRDIPSDRLPVALRGCDVLVRRTSELVARQASRSVVMTGV